jgi:hypothetical protein
MISRLLAALLALALVVAPGHAAIRSDGTDTQHLAGPYLSAVARGAVTIMQWHKLNADANTRKILFNYHNNHDGGTFHNIILWTQGDGTTADLITVVGTPSRFQTGVQSITVGTWYHYAIVRNGSTIRLYVGSETAASTLITTLEDSRLAPQTSVWRFTATGSSGSGLSADASIERFKLYNAALTLAEINAERTSLGPSSTTNLWSYNPFTAAGSYGGTDGSNPMTFTEQGGANFSTVSGPSPVAGPSAQLGRHWQDRGDDVDLRGRRWWLDLASSPRLYLETWTMRAATPHGGTQTSHDPRGRAPEPGRRAGGF